MVKSAEQACVELIIELVGGNSRSFQPKLTSKSVSDHIFAGFSAVRLSSDYRLLAAVRKAAANVKKACNQDMHETIHIKYFTKCHV